MPKKIQKTLQDYLSKIKTPHPPQIQLPFNSLSSSKNWILSGCKHPKTPSFALDGRNEAPGGSSSNNHIHNHNDDAATLEDVDRFLFENFKSLYLEDDAETKKNKNTKRVSEESHEEAAKLGPILFESPRLVETPRDLCGSTRFFVKPGFSGSLVEDAMTSMTTTCDDEARSSSATTTTATLNDSSSDSKEAMNMDHKTLPDNCIAILTYSPSPYEDFRRSMQDMVEARSRNHEGDIDWEFMEELLFCYLNLNEKKSHKFILSAFVDVITTLRRSYGNSETAPAKPRSVRTVRINGREKKQRY